MLIPVEGNLLQAANVVQLYAEADELNRQRIDDLIARLSRLFHKKKHGSVEQILAVGTGAN